MTSEGNAGDNGKPAANRVVECQHFECRDAKNRYIEQMSVPRVYTIEVWASMEGVTQKEAFEERNHHDK